MWTSTVTGLIIIFCFGCSNVSSTTASNGFSQVRLTIADSSSSTTTTSMIVTWQAMGAATNDVEGNTVLYGTTANNLDSKAVPFRSKTYVLSGKHFHALLPNLVPGTTYFYKIAGMSDASSFTAPQLSTHHTVSFVVIGDLGFTSDSVPTRNSIEHWKSKVDFFLHPGDISYADDAYQHLFGPDLQTIENYENVWNGFLDSMQDITAIKPYMVGVGNHESDCHSPYCISHKDLLDGLSNFTAYNARFANPNVDVTHNMWSSFNYGPAHFVNINTETDFAGAPEEFKGANNVADIPCGSFGKPGELVAFVTNDLAAAKKTVDAGNSFNWIITYGHHHLFTEGDVNCKTPAACDAFLGLINQYSDLHIQGHQHFYSRNTPVSGQPGPIMLLVGGTGNDEWSLRELKTEESGTSSKFEWLSFGTDQSYVVVNITNRDTLVVTAINSVTNEVFDTIQINKDPTTGKNSFSK